jgi:hypothetical protein
VRVAFRVEESGTQGIGEKSQEVTNDFPGKYMAIDDKIENF